MALWNIWKIFFVVFVKVDYLYSYLTDNDIITYIEEHDISCLSCANQCGESSVDISFACSCDSDWMFYGDCCPDYIKHCSDKGENKGILYHEGPDMTCKSVGNGSTLMVSSCPYSVRACLTETNAFNDHLQFTVYDILTGVHYIQIECALCNGLMADNLIYMVTGNDTYNFTMDGNLDPGRRNNKISDMENMKQRWCLPEDKSTSKCPTSTEDRVYKKRVTGLLQNVSSGQLYKNVYCLLCNANVTELIFSCPTEETTDDTLFRESKQPSRNVLNYYFSGVGLTLAGLCRDGYTYDITDKICVPYTDEEENQFCILNVTLIHDKSRMEPHSLQHVAKSLIEPLQPVQLQIYLQDSSRDWKKGFDNIIFEANNTDLTPEKFQDISKTISRSIVNSSLGSYSKIIVNLLLSAPNENTNCKYADYEINSIQGNRDGLITTSDGTKVEPGYYHKVGQKIRVCVQFSESPPSRVITWIIIALFILSVILLIMHLVFNYIYKPKSGTRTSILGSCLLITDIALLLGTLVSQDRGACHAAGIVAHWGFLTSFSWVSFIAIDIWMCLTSKQRMIIYESKRLNSFIRYSLPFIPPTFIIVLTVILQHSSTENEWKANYGLAVVCWIFEVKVKNFLFVFPAAVSVCITLSFCSLCARHVFRLWTATRNPTAKHRSYFWMFVKLAGMTGLGWCFGLVAIPSGSDALFYVVLILIAIQGAGLFSVLWGYKIMTLCTKDGKIKRRKSPKTMTTPMSSSKD